MERSMTKLQQQRSWLKGADGEIAKLAGSRSHALASRLRKAVAVRNSRPHLKGHHLEDGR